MQNLSRRLSVTQNVTVDRICTGPLVHLLRHGPAASWTSAVTPSIYEWKGHGIEATTRDQLGKHWKVPTYHEVKGDD